MSKNFETVRRHLSKDPVMKNLIKRFGQVDATKSKNIFDHIVENIISQQLSEKAGSTIINRFKALWKSSVFPTPADILNIEDQAIRDCGVSFSKIKYIKGLSQMVEDGSIRLETLHDLPDEEVKRVLTGVKGIGNWTAEMILMFTLGREDVYSFGDVGLRNAISSLYGIEKNDEISLIHITETWKPYRTYACRYLWMSLDTKNDDETSKTKNTH